MNQEFLSDRLFVETSRWHKSKSIPINEMKCTVCNKLEDEYHSECTCISYNDLRKHLLPVYYWKRPNMFKSIDLINTENENIIYLSLHVFTIRTYYTMTDEDQIYMWMSYQNILYL